METNREKEELAIMLVRFYNMQADCSLRANGEANIKIVSEGLEKVNFNVIKIKNHIRAFVEKHKSDEKPLASRFAECIESLEADEVVAPVVQQTAQVTDNQVNYSMGILEQAVVQLISNMNSEKIEKNIMGTVEDKIRNFIKDEYGTIERKIVTVVNDKKVPMQGVQHDKFETVLKFVANNEPVFLIGPAGSGKNVICKQVAEALGLKFYFTNAVTQEYKLTGFTDAMGNYQPTQFYKAFTEGGVFMLDEMDASIPEVLVILNAAIANRYFDFPAPIGYVEAHPDFRVIAAGNTTGQGANMEYVGRSQLDGASLDRFAMIEIDYSKKIELNVTNGDSELVDFCRDYRQSAKKAGLNVIVSYRAMERLAKMIQLLSLNEALETCLVKGLEKDDLNIIVNGLKKNSKYSEALKEVARAA